MLKAIDTKSIFVKESALPALTSILHGSKNDILPYWKKVAELVFGLIRNAKSKEYRFLRSLAIECFTLTGDAVGINEFKKIMSEVEATMG